MSYAAIFAAKSGQKLTLGDYIDFVNSNWRGGKGERNRELAHALYAIGDPVSTEAARELESLNSLRDLFIMTTGLMGESGETCELLKKYIRDGVLDLRSLSLELGDVLYYLIRICSEFGLSLDQVMRDNILKLDARRGGAQP